MKLFPIGKDCERNKSLIVTFIVLLVIYMWVFHRQLLIQGMLSRTNNSNAIGVELLQIVSPVLTYGYNYGSNSECYVSNNIIAQNRQINGSNSVLSETMIKNDVETMVGVDISKNQAKDNGLQNINPNSLEDNMNEDICKNNGENIDGGISTSINANQLPFTSEQLSDVNYMVEHCYTIDSTTYVDKDEMNPSQLLSMDMTMKQDNSDYQILIYHTHSSSESFVDSRPGVLEDTPIGLGDELTKQLETYGYKVYHDRTVYDQIDGKIDRNYAYTAAGQGIDRILNEHPTIEVVIDLHRDGVNENTRLVTEINGKPTAKIMFFNGVSRTVKNGELAYLENPNRQSNLAFSLQMYLKGRTYYPDFLRNIYIKGYQYNLNRRPKSTLIEVGGQTNTVEEARNAMEPLAEILNQVLSDNCQQE